MTGKPVIKAFSIKTPEDVQRALRSPADYILLDQGAGGTGEPFDWPWFPQSVAHSSLPEESVPKTSAAPSEPYTHGL